MSENPPHDLSSAAERIPDRKNPESSEREGVIVAAYLETRAAAEAALESARRKNTETEKLSQVRSALGIASDEVLPKDVAVYEKEVVEAQANYPGHWTLLLADRLRDRETRKKFIAVRTEAMPSLQEGEPGPIDKEKRFQKHYKEQVDHYDEIVDSVFSKTAIGNAAEFNRMPIHAGEGSIGETGTVFLDAEGRDGTPLTARQKMIIEAHEKGHGVRDFQGSDATEIRSVLDASVLREREELAGSETRFANYLQNPDEIIERMAQLKNYFGFRGNEPFTKKHLEYAKAHYVTDTGLDNTMSHFFGAITPETEDRFLEVMNKYPI